ncbi:MAG: family 16 glycoside hydrolase [Planctomycetota bacterium]
MLTKRSILQVALVLLIGCGEAAKPVTTPAPVPGSGPSSTSVTPASPKPSSKPAEVADVKPDSQPLPSKESKPEAEKTPASTKAPDAAAQQDDSPFQLEKGFTKLTFADFEAFGAAEDTWEALEEGIFCSGRPRGYLYSKESYRNFTLRLDYSFDRPDNLKDDAKFKGNTGFLMYITGEHKQWPVSLEVQGKHIQMGAIKENGGAATVTATDDDAARQKARKPVGEWNSLEIVSVDGSLTVSLNGVLISKSEPDFLSEGLIGIQSEDFPFEVRRMRIRRD